MQQSLQLMENSKNQHDSFINIDCALCTSLDKGIPDQFKQVQQYGKHGVGDCASHAIIDVLFHTYGCAAATDISKIDNTIKTP